MSMQDNGPASLAGKAIARKAATLRRAMIDSVTEQDICDVTQRLLDLARDGQLAAIKLLLQYTLGKPGAAFDPAAWPDEQPAAAPRIPPAPAAREKAPATATPAPALNPEVLRQIDRAAGNPLASQALCGDPRQKATVSDRPPSTIGGKR
jgi:hypothetical protein